MTNGSSSGALAGLRVIDLTRVLGGPYCTQLLGDHGADVIKIEPPQGDDTRSWGPPFQDGSAAYYIGINRNKRGAVLDLNQPQGREILLGLLEGADVLIENFKSGTLEKWGLGYRDFLEARFPRLVHCSITGFGASGPLGGLPGYDAAVQAAAGLMSVNGEPTQPPLRIGVPIVDIVSGLNATIGILLALCERERSGRGQSIDIALYDSALSLLHPHFANFFLSGKVPPRTGSAHVNVCPYDTFRTRSTPIFLAVGNNNQFRKLCEVLGCPELTADARFATNMERCQNRDALKIELERRLVDHDCQPLADRLLELGVPCGPVLSIDAVVNHPHTKHREMIVEIGDYTGTGSPIKLSRSRTSYRLKPPKFGEHTKDIVPDRDRE